MFSDQCGLPFENASKVHTTPGGTDAGVQARRAGMMYQELCAHSIESL